jgi:serine/threonine protein kinase
MDFASKFDKLATLGKGRFSTVGLYKCTGTSGTIVPGVLVAVKSYSVEEMQRRDRQIRQEQEVLRVLSLGHRKGRICTLLDTIVEPEFGLHLMLTPLLGGPLHKHILRGNGGCLSPRAARDYAAEVLSALRAMHSKWCIHRDLKASNILVDDHGHVRVADFGSAKLIAPAAEEPQFDAIGNMVPSLRDKGPFELGYEALPRTHTLIGTASYMAPELFAASGPNGEGSSLDLGGRHHYSLPVDWWALGLLLYEMLAGEPPQWRNRATQAADVVCVCAKDGEAWDFDWTVVQHRHIRRHKEEEHTHKHHGDGKDEDSELLSSGLGLVSMLLEQSPTVRWAHVISPTGSSSRSSLTLESHPFFAKVDWKAVDAGTSRVPDAGFDRRLGFLDVLEQHEDEAACGENSMAGRGADGLTAEQQALFEGY